MSHRGAKAKGDANWRNYQNYQRRLGYQHGKTGHPSQYADEHYQRGYREGEKRARR